MRMPLARSVTARRPNAPCRFWNSVKPAKGDIERALELLGVAVHDVGEHTAFGCLVDEGGVAVLEDRDHRARRLANDPAD